MSDIDDLRRSVMDDPDEPFSSGFENDIVAVNEGKIFGLTAGERMILSIIVFMAVTSLSFAILLVTNTVVLR